MEPRLYTSDCSLFFLRVLSFFVSSLFSYRLASSVTNDAIIVTGLHDWTLFWYDWLLSKICKHNHHL